MDDVITKLTSQKKSRSKSNSTNNNISRHNISTKVSHDLNSSDKSYSENNISDDLLDEINTDVNQIQTSYFKWSNLPYVLSVFIVGFIIMNIIIYFEYITIKINHYLGKLFNTSVEVTEKGVEGTTDIVSDALHGNLNTLNKMIDGNIIKNNIDNKNIIQENSDEKEDVLPVETTDNKPAQKNGYCYVGTDRGYRSCIKVGESDKCMSGDIFPSKDICINPSLRE